MRFKDFINRISESKEVMPETIECGVNINKIAEYHYKKVHGVVPNKEHYEMVGLVKRLSGAFRDETGYVIKTSSNTYMLMNYDLRWTFKNLSEKDLMPMIYPINGTVHNLKKEIDKTLVDQPKRDANYLDYIKRMSRNDGKLT